MRYRDDSEATVLPAPMSRELLEAPPSPPQPHHQASRSVIVMPQHAPQQSMQQVETIPGRPVIKASAVRLVSSHLYQPFEQDKMGTLQSLFGKVPGTADQLYICLHPASAPGLPLTLLPAHSPPSFWIRPQGTVDSQTFGHHTYGQEVGILSKL